MNNKELQNKIYEDAKDIPIPKALEPESIAKKLDRRKKNIRWKIAATAACLLITVTGVSIFAANQVTNQFEKQFPGLKQEADYDHLYSLIRKSSSQYEKYIVYDDGMAGEGNTTEAPEVSKESSSDDSFSTTNIQVEGVDEGDIVKTDGNYIYTVNNNRSLVNIIQIDRGNMTQTATIPLQDNEYIINEIYLSEDKLMIIADKGFVGYIPYEYDYPNQEAPNNTIVLTYDISDRTFPQFIGKITQSGLYQSSRLQGNYLYVFTDFTANTAQGKKERNCYIPSVNDQLLPSDDICMPQDPQSVGYLVMTSMSLNNPTKTADQKAIFTSADIFYVSQSNIYSAAQMADKTEIIKFSYKKGQFSQQASTKVKGYLESSFSMDEYEGNLRLVTTVEKYWGSMYNNVYVLNKNLKQIGNITGLAENERVYSARFMGKQGYFVTYRETDPLFSVDFSNPRQPKIIGSLKIPGFSEYLHFYGENRLLGIGMEDTGQGLRLKLSMFDISDPTNVKEIHKYAIDANSSDALYDHRAVMIDVEKNIFGFAVNGSATGDGAYEASYRIYSYTDSGFQEKCRIPAKSGYGAMNDALRGVYSGSFFYLLEPDLIRSFTMRDFRQAKSLGLQVLE